MAKLAAIGEGPNPDGSYDVTIDHNGEQIAVNIPSQRVQELIAKFQVQIFEMSEPTLVPNLAVRRIDVVRKEATCEVTVSTAQTGTIVLAMTDADLRQMKKAIDSVLAYRRDSTAKKIKF
jgi:hypothetical protein